jgi:hypothetical protein
VENPPAQRLGRGSFRRYGFRVTEAENALLAALKELEASVAGMANTSPKPDLRPLFERLRTLTDRLPADADPNLLHYMARQSWQKARCHLEAKSRGAAAPAPDHS